MVSTPVEDQHRLVLSRGKGRKRKRNSDKIVTCKQKGTTSSRTRSSKHNQHCQKDDTTTTSTNKTSTNGVSEPKSRFLHGHGEAAAAATATAAAAMRITSAVDTIRVALGADYELVSLPEFLQRNVPRLELSPNAVQEYFSNNNNNNNSQTKGAAEASKTKALLAGMRLAVKRRHFPCLDKIKCQPVRKESLPSLVDHVVWTLVQRRDRWRAKKQQQKQVTASQPKQKSKLGCDAAEEEEDGRNLLCQGYIQESDFSYNNNNNKNSTSSKSSWAQQQKQQPYNHAFPSMVLGNVCKNVPLTMVQLNCNVDYCQNSHLFQVLHELLGDDVLRVILLHTRIFLPILPTNTFDTTMSSTVVAPDSSNLYTQNSNNNNNNNQHSSKFNYLQLTGAPLRATAANVVTFLNCPNREPAESAGRKRKRRKNRKQEPTKAGDATCMEPVTASNQPAASITQSMVTQQQQQQQQKRKPTPGSRVPNRPDHVQPHAIISRRCLFYSNSFIPRVGLAQNHILNDSTLLEPAVALLSQMVELPTATKSNRRHCVALKNNANRRNRQCKRWKRLCVTGVQMCEDIRQRHLKHCDYKRLLDHYCPMPAICHKQYHPTNQSSGALLRLPEAASSYTPSAQVVSFVAAVLKRVFPPAFWGTPENFSQVLKHVETFILLRRQEQMPNKTVLQGIRVSQIAWLHGKANNGSFEDARKQHCARTDHEAAELLLLRVLRWVLGQFVVPLLQSCFHATETEFSGKQVLFYRKPVWAMFRALSIQKLLTKQYTEISALEAQQRLERQQMGFSRLRLLPKSTGVRPIAMLCKRESIQFPGSTSGPKITEITDEDVQIDDDDDDVDMDDYNGNSGLERKKQKTNHPNPPPSQSLVPSSKQQQLLSTNAILRDSFAILKYEHLKNEVAFGAGVRGLHYFYPRYRRFIEDLKPRESNDRKLYFASVDIQHCYDNIDQDYLLKVIQGILSEQDYIVQRYSVVHPVESMGRILKRYDKQVNPPELFTPFYRMSEDLTKTRHRSVFVDGVSCTSTTKAFLMQQLCEHLRSHLVVVRDRFGDRYLIQSTGIPQGSVLSTMLCNYYYGSIERKLFSSDPANKREENDLLVRMVDDFMLVSSQDDRLGGFLKTMDKGDEELGVRINKEKTQVSVNVNFQRDDGSVEEILADNKNPFFSWCGMLFDVQTGEVRIDYSRFYDGACLDGLTVDRASREGKHFVAQMKTFTRPRCVPILFDPLINSATVQFVNFYQLMLLGAAKTALYLLSSNMVERIATNHSFLLSSINSTIAFSYGLVSARLRSERADSKLCVERDDAVFLAWTSFHDIFSLVPPLESVTHSILNAIPKTVDKEPLHMALAKARQEIDIQRLLSITKVLK